MYASSDIHVSASEFETLGNTVLEAFASGIPVVVPQTQGFCDTVLHEEDGYLFQPSDVADARRYISQLALNASLRRELGRRGREKVLGRSIDRVVNDMLEWYNIGITKRKRMNLIVWFLKQLLLSTFAPFASLVLVAYETLSLLFLGLIASKNGKKEH